jgi:hypothetical protein
MSATAQSKLTPARAKKILIEEMNRLEISYSKLTAQTVCFGDLARASCLFVKIYEFNTPQHAEKLEAMARKHGFRVQLEKG